MRARAVIACVSITAFFVLVACSTDEPEISEVKARRLLIQGESGSFSAALSVFALFNGGGSADDFGMMTVTHDDSDIFWEIPASDALLFPGGNDYSWVGSSSLLPIPSVSSGGAAGSPIWGTGGFFPNGSYTVTADNAAGSSATASFVLDKPFYFATQPAAFRLSGEGDNARWSIVLSENISPRDVSVYLFLLNEDSNPLSSIRITVERFRGRRAEGQVSELAKALSSRQEEDSTLTAVSCYVEHSGSASAVMLAPLTVESQ